jgi:hypothetical protein
MDVINLDFVDNPYAAAVAVVIVLAIAVWPGVMAWLNSRATKHTVRATKTQLDHEMNPNSGGSLKDALNRIEGRQQDQGQVLLDHGLLLTEQAARLLLLERTADRRGGRLFSRRR